MSRPHVCKVAVDWRGLDLDITGTYTPGEPDHTSGPPDDWEQGYPAEFEVGEVWYCLERQRAIEDCESILPELVDLAIEAIESDPPDIGWPEYGEEE
jgi:hypothetical protein